jgi:hypothetical protein
VDENHAPEKPGARIDDQPSDLPGLIVEEEIIDGANSAIAGHNRECFQNR